MKRKWLVIGTVLALFGGMRPQLSFAAPASTQVDSLIKKLVEKGVLTDDEADKLKDEIVSDEKTIRESNMKKDLPSWVQDIKLSGDFRLREQYEQRKGSETRNRARIRYRLGIGTKITDQVEIAAGLASGGTDPRSTNQTLQDSFSHKGINLDYAYAKYTPNQKISLSGGKLKDLTVWEPADLLWDTDIRPEGGLLSLNYKVNDQVNLFSNISALVVDENQTSNDTSDPFMYAVQGGVQGKVTESIDYKLAETFYGFDNLKKGLLDNRSSPATNTTTATSQYKFLYNVLATGAEFGINDPFGEAFPIYIGRIGFIGEFVHNPDPDDNNNGWLGGMYLGSAKVSGKGQWKLTGSYRYLGKDAWLDTFPDSDFYGGATDVKGYEAILEYGLTKNVIFGIDYYHTQRITATPKAPESVLQTDLVFKF
jgi:polyhydroxyalkanoate synthesis regulator phasin